MYHGNVTGLIRLWDSLPGKPLRSWDPPDFIGGVLWRRYDAATQLCDSMQQKCVSTHAESYIEEFGSG